MANFSYRIGLFLFGLQLAWMAVACHAATIEPTSENIARLIAELGSDEYFVRQRAEAELQRMGPEAFDALMAVDEDDDLEIAARARYLLSRMWIDWTNQRDSLAVQQVMARYRDLRLLERKKRITRLAKLDDDQGLAALCRVARYETSPLLARIAALQIITGKNRAANRETQGFELLSREVGKSRRVPIEWVRTYLDQKENPSGAVGRWTELIQAENELLAKEFGETSNILVSALLEYQLKLCDDLLGTHPAIREDTLVAVERLVEIQAKHQEQEYLGLFQVLNWVRLQETWNVLELLENRFATQLKKHRRLLYLIATIRDKRGRKEEADQVAQRAFKLAANDNHERNRVANELLSLGRLDWAEREWRYVIDSYPIANDHSVEARRSLASWCLHDRGEDQEAAQLLIDYFEVVDRRQGEEGKPKVTFEGVSPLRAQRDYYLACHAESQGDYAQQRKLLDSAVKYNEIDADVLIAMYHLQGADDAYHQQTQAQIRKVSLFLLRLIERSPNDPSNYNHWAWLISNTEGDFQKAVELSHRSLELNPDEASFLDTLGRCYYAAGDLENAIKFQRQAVKLNPQLRVMQSQLKQFEKEWEAKRKNQASQVVPDPNNAGVPDQTDPSPSFF